MQGRTMLRYQTTPGKSPASVMPSTSRATKKPGKLWTMPVKVATAVEGQPHPDDTPVLPFLTFNHKR